MNKTQIAKLTKLWKQVFGDKPSQYVLKLWQSMTAQELDERIKHWTEIVDLKERLRDD